MDIAAAKALVIEAGKELVERGLIARTWGNVSCRVDEKHFVIHTHQEWASVISGLDIDDIEPDSRYRRLACEIPVTKYGLPSTKKLSRHIGACLEHSQSKGIVLKNHGALCYGSDYEDTFLAAVELEEGSRDYVLNRFRQISGEEDAEEEALYRFLLRKYEKTESPQVSAETGEALVKFQRKRHKTVSVVTAPACRYAGDLGMSVRPMVDDFAQIIGLKVMVCESDSNKIKNALTSSAAVLVPGLGAICAGDNPSDVEAVEMIIEKTCKAHMAAALFGRPKPINAVESKLMNVIYKKKYSKQK